MTDNDRRRQGALQLFVGAIGFMLVTLPLALLSDVHRASADANSYGGPLRVGAFEYAWPVYVVVAIGAIWLCFGFLEWSEAHDSEKRAGTPQSLTDSID